jgi:hypothetical protein
MGFRRWETYMASPPPELARELAGSEKALWSGQPKQGVVFRAMDLFVVPLSLAWCGIAIFIFFQSMRAPKVPIFFYPFSFVFVLVGIYIVVGRFLVDARQRSRTFYAVTNERIIIASGLFSRTLKSIDLKTLAEMSLSERKNGSGFIVFGSSSPMESMIGAMPAWPGMQGRFASRFDLIAEVRPVYDIIRSAQRALTRSA